MAADDLRNDTRLVTTAIEPTSLRSEVAALSEIAAALARTAAEQVTAAMVQGAGYEAAQQATALLRAQLDRHEARLADGLREDEDSLALTIHRYERTDRAIADAALALAGTLGGGGR